MLKERGQVKGKKKGSGKVRDYKKVGGQIRGQKLIKRLKLIYVNFEVKRKKKFQAQILHKLSGIAKVFKNVQKIKDHYCKINFIKNFNIDKYCFLALVPHIYRADHRDWSDHVHLQVLRLQHHWVLHGSFSKVTQTRCLQC